MDLRAPTHVHAKRRLGLTQPNDPNQSLVGYGFGESDDSDDSSQRQPVRVSKVVIQSPHTTAEKAVLVRTKPNETAAPERPIKQQVVKSSQIQRLVTRRRDAQQKLGTSGEPVSDEIMFRYDVGNCAEQVDSATYKATPVEGFGASMLRAMGWKGNVTEKAENGEYTSGSKLPRPLRLGLGAKPSDLASEQSKKRPRSVMEEDRKEKDAGTDVDHIDENRKVRSEKNGTEGNGRRERSPLASDNDSRSRSRRRRAERGEARDMRYRSKRSRFSDTVYDGKRENYERSYDDRRRRSSYERESYREDDVVKYSRHSTRRRSK